MLTHNVKQRKRDFRALGVNVEIHVGETLKSICQADHSTAIYPAQLFQLRPGHLADLTLGWVGAIHFRIMIKNHLAIRTQVRVSLNVENLNIT